jgi:NAD-dependent deacetylase
MPADDALEKAAGLLGRAESVVVLTGAGISTESGIPDFRSPGGLWSRYDPAKLTFDRFLASAETRRLYWEIATESYPVLRDAQPNAAHRAVTAIETCGRLLMLITQNVDGLHQKAGTSGGKVIEIHGSSLRVTCVDCGAPHDRDEVHARVLSGDRTPGCDLCGGRLKPATVSFGQSMPEAETLAAFDAARRCDLMIVIGSSLVVYPAAGLPDEAVRAGASLIIVNREATDKDHLAAATIRGSAGESMSLLLRSALGEEGAGNALG